MVPFAKHLGIVKVEAARQYLPLTCTCSMSTSFVFKNVDLRKCAWMTQRSVSKVFVDVPRSQSWGKIWDYIFGTPKHTPATLAQIKDLDEAVFAPAPVRKAKKDSTFAPAPPLNALNSSFLQQPEAQLLSSSLSRTFSLIFGCMCRSEPGAWYLHVLN